MVENEYQQQLDTANCMLHYLKTVKINVHVRTESQLMCIFELYMSLSAAI